MALAAMRSETHIIRFKTHPTGEYRDGAICMESCNNTAHILLHCPISNFIWALAADVIKILTGIKIRLDPKLIMLNFTDNPILCKADKKIIKYVNTIFIISKIIVYILHYRGDGNTKSADILEEWKKH